MLQNFAFTRPTLRLRNQQNWLKSLSFKILSCKMVELGVQIIFILFQHFALWHVNPTKLYALHLTMKTTTLQAQGLASLGSWKGQKGKIALLFVLQHVKAKRSFARPNPNLMDAQLKDNVSLKTVSFPHFMMMISVAYGSSASTVDTQKVFLPWDFGQCCQLWLHFWQKDLMIPWDKRVTVWHCFLP